MFGWKKELEPEEALIVGIIKRAILDYTHEGVCDGVNITIKDKESAAMYFRSRLFVEHCYMLGVEPYLILERLL